MIDWLTRIATRMVQVGLAHAHSDDPAKEAIDKLYPEPGEVDNVDLAARCKELEGALRDVVAEKEGWTTICDDKDCALCNAVRRAKRVLDFASE